MAIRQYKPTSAGRRVQIGLRLRRAHQGQEAREAPASKSRKRSGGRNANGRITARHRGGGHKRRYRIVDFKRDKDGVPASVAAIEYDPNRSARLALLHYADGEKRYILAPVGLRVGDTVDGRAGSGHQAGQRAAAAEHSAGDPGAQRRAAAGARRPAGAQRRDGDPADGEGGQAGAAEAALGRVAPGAGRVSRHDRRRSAMPTTRTCRWARPVAPAGSDGARRSAASR